MKNIPSPGYREFVVLMAAMTALDAVSIDSIVPALAHIDTDLQLPTANHRQWVVNALFAGFAIGVFLYGFVADSIGRRLPTIVAFGIYAVGTLVCMKSATFAEMVAGRAIQGFGAAGPYVLSIAIVRDSFKGRQMAKIMSLILMIFIGVPMVAPFAGQLILQVAGWRSIFLVLLVFALSVGSWFWLRQPETLKPDKKIPLGAATILKNVIEVLRHPLTCVYLVAMALVTGAFIAYLGTAQQIFQDIYHTGTRFPVIFASMAAAIGLSSWLNSRWVKALGMATLLNRALLGVAASSAGYLILGTLWPAAASLWCYLIYLFAVMFCYGLIFGNLTSLALEPMGHIAGAASSVINSLATVGAILVAALIGSNLGSSPVPVVTGFGCCCLTSFILVYLVRKNTAQGTNTTD